MNQKTDKDGDGNWEIEKKGNTKWRMYVYAYPLRISYVSLGVKIETGD